MGNKSSQQESSSEKSVEEGSSSQTSRRSRSSSAASASSVSSSSSITSSSSAAKTTATPRSANSSPPRSNDAQKSKPSYYQMVKQGYAELVNAIIRPPRCEYDIEQLGPQFFDFCDKHIIRKDFELINPKGEKIQCSHWEPDETSRPSPILPCVIYMHGNSSSRLEALPQLSLVLHIGATLFTFDFAGSGKSDGEYVSLGAFEKDDLQCVIEHLRECSTTSTIALWGRSMGAATALLHGERDPSIAGMILDSAFTDLETLAEELVDKGRQHGLYAPGFVVSIAIRFIRSSVQKTAGFDIKDLSPIAHADRCFIPALFIAAEGDKFIPPHHSQRIYDKYAGDKNIILVDGDHNSLRPRFMQDSVTIFLLNTLRIPEEWIVEDGVKYIGYLPWANKRYPKYSTNGSSNTSSSSSGGGKASEKRPVDLTSDQNTGIKDMGFGMTGERQAEIQARLFQLAGQGSGITPSSSSSVAAPFSPRIESDSTTPINVKIPRYQPIKVKKKTSKELDSNETAEENGLDMKDSSNLSGSNDMNDSNEDIEDTDDVIIETDDHWSPINPEDYSASYVNYTSGGYEVPYLGDGLEWTCQTCTLINSDSTEFCMACGIPRF